MICHATSIPILWCRDFSTIFTVKMVFTNRFHSFFAEFGEVREFLASEGYLSSRAKALQLRRRKSGSETTQEKNVSLVYEDENV